MILYNTTVFAVFANTISPIIDHNVHSSFTCCSHLKGVATRFNATAAIEKIEIYYKFVDDFCQYKLANHIYMKPFLTATFDFTPSTTITFKLRWHPSDKTLSDILELLQQAFDEQSIHVHIVVVRGGSVRVICCAPQYLMTELVRLAQKNRELLVESSVTYLRVGDTIVVDTTDQNEVRICYHRTQRKQSYYTVHMVLVVIGTNSAALPASRQVKNPAEFACRSPKQS